ncbi:YheC/YheD family protein [Cohnella endophytica]|uniref:YheC/YheD family protein n=1 Tax=Cohnella endophytica TaxID=2419778 RepID=A0A494Y2S2_9BACL|nr:YheC/YheD family protein [Cohnella endophytica]RKP54196.1 YheC/YheD family protein [Cohnella endophytica]
MPVTFPNSKPYRNVGGNDALGILVYERDDDPPFAESSFIRRLNQFGSARGMPLFAFAPWTWEERNGSVKGWSWNDREGRWEPGRRMLPSVVYDRAWPETDAEKLRYRQAVRRLRESVKLVFLNGRLPNKGKVYECLAKNRTFSAYIPPTALFRGSASLSDWLSKHSHAAFLKPIAGSQGRRVVAIVVAEDGTVKLSGRRQDNQPFEVEVANEATALRRIERWIGSRPYIMQPFLELKGDHGEPFDLRALMQKGGDGRWSLTGIAARCGSPGMVTANLHGGGKASSARTMLSRLFGDIRGRELFEEATNMSYMIAVRLENVFGRFAEIGLDYGIDRSGKLWFLEANSKPGRAAMVSAGAEAARAAAEQPLSYARSILLRLATTDTRRSPQGRGCSLATTDMQRSLQGNGYATPGRVIHEFDHL